MITIPGQTIKMDIPTGIEPVWYDKLKVLFETVNNLWIGPNGRGTAITASLGVDVNLTDTSRYFDGPSLAQGTVGTWWASGTVLLTDASGAAGFHAKLWDGTTIISSSAISIPVGSAGTLSLSGFITSPTNNLRISVKDLSSVNGKILFNLTGSSKDATISAFRIA